MSGVVLALLSFYLLILPARTKALNSQNNQELITYTEKLDASNRENTELKEKYDTMESQYTNVQNQLTQYENQNASFMSQYQTLNQITAAYQSGDIVTAATLYTALDQASITEANMVNLLNQIKSYMEGTGYQTLADLGTNSWNAGNLTQAESYFQLSVTIRQEPENMFLLARLYQAEGKTADANALFDKIVGEHPESPYAEKSRVARGY